MWVCPLFVPCRCLCHVQDSRRFGQHISKAMLDIRALFEAEHRQKAQENEKQPRPENGKNHVWESPVLLFPEHLWWQVALSRFKSWPFHAVRRKGRFLFIYIYTSKLNCFWCRCKAVQFNCNFCLSIFWCNKWTLQYITNQELFLWRMLKSICILQFCHLNGYFLLKGTFQILKQEVLCSCKM